MSNKEMPEKLIWEGFNAPTSWEKMAFESLSSVWFVKVLEIVSHCWCKMDCVFLPDLIHHLLVMGKSSSTMLLVERLPSKIYTTDLFEVVPQPNIAAHII